MSNSNAQFRAPKKRNYRLQTRAQKQEETRQRIVEAAVDLHTTLGPAQTSVSQIAQLAGVQRHTYYAHFPEERDLFLACSARALERNPLPNVEGLGALPPGQARLRAGLEGLYLWYRDNAVQAACLLRDAEIHALTREMVELRLVPIFARAGELLGEGLPARAIELLAVALDFNCWRALSQAHTPQSAAALMTDALCNLPAQQDVGA